MNSIRQHRTGSRGWTLDPFDPQRERDRPVRRDTVPSERHATAAALIGCVDWYLYPVNEKAQEPRAG